jgi:hypothetical protein
MDEFDRAAVAAAAAAALLRALGPADAAALVATGPDGPALVWACSAAAAGSAAAAAAASNNFTGACAPDGGAAPACPPATAAAAAGLGPCAATNGTAEWLLAAAAGCGGGPAGLPDFGAALAAALDLLDALPPAAAAAAARREVLPCGAGKGQGRGGRARPTQQPPHVVGGPRRPGRPRDYVCYSSSRVESVPLAGGQRTRLSENCPPDSLSD